MAGIQAVVLEALARDAEEIGAAEFASVATAVTEAVADLQATAVEALVTSARARPETLANTDPLTGLANMRHLQSQLRHNLGLAKRYEQPFALLVIDVDGLKRDQRRPRPPGRRPRAGAGRRWPCAARSARVDTPARIGGDEFCMLAPSQTAEAARPLAERLAAAVAGETAGDDADPGVGASVGVVVRPRARGRRRGADGRWPTRRCTAPRRRASRWRMAEPAQAASAGGGRRSRPVRARMAPSSSKRGLDGRKAYWIRP